jgi:hypothetical protein
VAHESRSDGWKLASYEVAGGDEPNKFVLKARWMARMFRRPFRTEICWGRFQTLRVWLISGRPCRVAYLPVLVRKSFSKRAKTRSKASWFFRFEKSGM